MTDSPLLALPYLAAAQAQKHVTHNQALARLDGLVQLAVADRDLTAPPGSPAEGDRYLVAAGASGAWSGWDASVAVFTAGTWTRLVPNEGWLVWVADEAVALIRSGGAWSDLAAAAGYLARASSLTLAEAPLGASLGVAVIEEELTGLSGAAVDTAIAIPDRAILLGVSTRTATMITGASSYDCGIAGETSKFGGALGISAGASNLGVIGPQAFYAATPIRLTANGGAFSGGAVRVAIHCLTIGAPT